MSLAHELKALRQREFLTQEAFAKEINVSCSSVIRWENGKTKPNLTAMKSIKNFCETHGAGYDRIESEWLSSTEEELE